MSTFNITVDDADAMAMLNKLGAVGNDPKVLKKIGLAAKQEAYNAFRTQTAPWGTPWQALAESTLKTRARKGNHNTQPLIDTGAMYASIEAQVSGDSVLLSVGNGLPDARAWYNQFVTDNAPQRAFFPIHDAAAPANPSDEWLQRVLVAPVEAAITEATR